MQKKSVSLHYTICARKNGAQMGELECMHSQMKAYKILFAR
jgi:hypothetical protein